MSLQIYFGPMFAGKSTRTREKVTTLADVGMKALYINHSDDKRQTQAQDSNITTHHSGFVHASRKIDTISTDDLSKIDVSKYQVIGVDEFQFFDSDQNVECVRRWVEEQNKTVFVSALDGDSNKKTFGLTWKLIPLADKVVKMRALCTSCQEKGKKVKAAFTAKLVPDEKQKDVGGEDKYRPFCRKCHQKHNNKFNKK